MALHIRRMFSTSCLAPGSELAMPAIPHINGVSRSQASRIRAA
jgi:hypothetical protein